MPDTKTTRSARLADQFEAAQESFIRLQFEAAQESFIRLVESLTVEHWRMKGKNTPEVRINTRAGRSE